jgi:Lrp/AsnC family transcriptional regulator, leucine-responsive regulatory protein
LIVGSNATKTHFMTKNDLKHLQGLDAFDRAILRILQEDNKTPQRQIADAVNLSAAAVQRRIAAMEASGVITKNVAILDPGALSLGITAIVEVWLQDERSKSVDAAKELFRQTPEVQQCYFATGGVSFVLVIITSDMRAYEQLTRRLFGDNDNIRSYRTLIALDRVKSETSITIAE